MRQQNAMQYAIQTIAWFFLLMTGIALSSGLFFIIRPLLFRPFGEYPVQFVVGEREILDPRDGAGLAIVHLSAGKMMVRATKCINSDTPIHTVGSNAWTSADPVNIAVVPGSTNSNVRQPGCRTITYTNLIPKAVTVGLWKIQGTEQAIGKDVFGDLYQTVTWETETFDVRE